jgi:hypothetical protein
MENPRPAMFVSPPAHHTVADPYPHVVARDKGETFTEGPVQELTFDDVLDLVNPLQHLPVISTIYRAITGDKIKPAMQIMGDLGYGGPTGFVLSCFQVLFNQISGDDIGGHILSFLDGKDSPKVAAAPASGAEPAPQLASAAEAPPVVAADPPAATAGGPPPAPLDVADAIQSYRNGTNR